MEEIYEIWVKIYFENCQSCCVIGFGDEDIRKIAAHLKEVKEQTYV